MNNTNHWKLGFFVVLCIGLLIGSLLYLGLQRLHRPFVRVYTYFDEAVDGLEVGSPVKFRGIKVGEVAAVRPASDEEHIEVTAHIYEDVLADLGLDSPTRAWNDPEAQSRLARMRCQLVTSFLTGISFLQTDFFDPEVYPPKLYDFPTREPMLDAIPSTMRQLEKGLGEALQEFPKAIERARGLFDDLRGEIEGLELGDMARRARSILTRLDDRLGDFDAMPMVASATGAFASLDATLAELRDPGGPLQSLLTQLASAADSADRQLSQLDLAGAVQGVGGAADEVQLLSQELRRQVRDLDRAVAAFQQLMEMLERDPGALLRGKSAPTPVTGR